MSVNVQNKRKRKNESGGPLTTLQIQNFGKFKKKKDIQRLFETAGIVDYGVVKTNYTEPEAFVEFPTEVEMREAIRKIEEVKGDKYRMFGVETTQKKKFTKTNEKKTLEDAVTPWSMYSYPKQLQKKLQYVRSAWKYNARDLKINEIVASPEIDAYRNTCEFTFGKNREGKKSVGFLHGLFSEGFLTVEFPDKIKTVPEEFLEILGRIRSFLTLVEQEDLDCYNKLESTGFWRLVKLRKNENNEVILMLQLNNENISASRFERFKKEIVPYLLESKFEQSTIHGLYFQIWNGRSNAAPESSPLECISGGPIQHKICGKIFQMGPLSFFQVNLKATEILYKKALEWAHVGSKEDGTGEDTLLLDVCCGTGTIGIIGAEYVKKVIGLEINQSSVIDARKNAQLNQVHNVEFIAGPAEKTLSQALRTHSQKDYPKVVAICDPPRCGLHPSVLSALYLCSRIERIVYVSCNPTSCASDCAYLTGIKTTKKIRDKKTLTTENFQIQKIVAVDMFPHTKHCENLVLLER